MNLPKGLASKISSTGFMSSKGMPAPRRMGGQSAFNAPRPLQGMFMRPSIIANKARGTMSSATYTPIPASVSGIGQFGMAAQGSQAGMGIPQPQGSFAYPAGAGPKRIA